MGSTSTGIRPGDADKRGKTAPPGITPYGGWRQAVNHYQDIDDGLEEFEENKDRQEAEERLRQRPALFDRMVSGDPFCATVIQELMLIGPRTGRDDHPFSFESGYANVVGVHRQRAKVLAFRWSENGKTLEISMTDHDRTPILNRMAQEAVDDGYYDTFLPIEDGSDV